MEAARWPSKKISAALLISSKTTTVKGSLPEEQLYKASTVLLALVLLALVCTYAVSRHWPSRRQPPAMATIATQTQEYSELESFPAMDLVVNSKQATSNSVSSTSSSLLHKLLSPCLSSPGAVQEHVSGKWLTRETPEAQNWLEKMIITLTKVRRAPDGGIDVLSYLSCAGDLSTSAAPAASAASAASTPATAMSPEIRTPPVACTGR